VPLKDLEKRRAYQRKYQKAWRAKNRAKHTAIKRGVRHRIKEWLQAYKAERGCARCDEADPACLCFHHRDPATKEFDLGDGAHRYGRKKLQREIDKCDVLCLNCHAKLHNAG